MLLSVEVVVEARNELGEGVLWSPVDNEVQWTDIFGRRFWTYRPSDGASRSVALPDRLACFAPLGGKRLLAGFAGGLEVFDLESGARQPIAAVEPDLSDDAGQRRQARPPGKTGVRHDGRGPARRPADRSALLL